MLAGFFLAAHDFPWNTFVIEEAVDERGEKPASPDIKTNKKSERGESFLQANHVALLRYDQIRCAGEQTSPR